MNDLDPDDLHIRTWRVFPGGTSHVQILTSYVKAVESCRLTDIGTDREVMRDHSGHATKMAATPWYPPYPLPWQRNLDKNKPKWHKISILCKK